MQKIVMWAPEEGDKIVITKDSKNHTYKAGDIFTVNRATMDSLSVTIKEKAGIVVPYEDYQMIPPVKKGIELDSSKLKVTYYDAKIGHAAALDAELRLYYSRDNLKTWQEVILNQNDEKREIKDVTITISARLKKPMSEAEVAQILDEHFAKEETFKSWGTLVKGKNWEVEPMLRPNHVQKHAEEKIATRLLCAIEQMSKAPKVNNVVQFSAVKDGKTYNIPADEVHGLYEALHAYYVELKDWCWLEEAEKELGEAYKVRENIALALGMPEVATFEEIAEQSMRLKQMGEQMERLKEEYQKARQALPDANSPTLAGKVTDRSPFKTDLRRPSQSVGIAGNQALQRAVEMVTNMVSVPLTPVKAIPLQEEIVAQTETDDQQITLEEAIEAANVEVPEVMVIETPEAVSAEPNEEEDPVVPEATVEPNEEEDKVEPELAEVTMVQAEAEPVVSMLSTKTLPKKRSTTTRGKGKAKK